METKERKLHWNKIYSTKKLDEVSWYQPNPFTALNFIEEYNIPFTANIIDVGGGDSFLTDKLIEIGFENVTLLDISAKAIERTKKRLAENAAKASYIESDITDFETENQYDFWHDRAAFHFLTDEKEIEKYVSKVERFVKPNGLMVIGTFSEEGPNVCSGLNIKQYNEKNLVELFSKQFEKLKCIVLNHETPSGKIQNFIFCSFRKADSE